ncbi:MAG: M23 family metallopeptidase [Bacteroidota bacterium]
MSVERIAASVLIFHLLLFGCKTPSPNSEEENISTDSISNTQTNKTILSTYQIADAFDFPVGPPDAKGYYNAQPFGENLHLGDDWNAVTGGNTDLGDPIFSIANGRVSLAQDMGVGWGNVIRIVHYLPNGKSYESLYAHCDSMRVSEGAWVKRGEQIGTIGNANGLYLAHLHLEIRNQLDMDIGGGYAADTRGYVDPTQFINSYRKTLSRSQDDTLQHEE